MSFLDEERLTDSQLLVEVRYGSELAFEELWHRHQPAALSYARRFAGQSDAGDIVAEAMAAIWNACTNGSGPSEEFRPYLYRAVRNTAIRWNLKLRRLPIPVDNVGLEQAEDTSTFSEDDGALAFAFSTLSSRDRALLWHFVVDHENARSVGKILGMTESAVYSGVRRAKFALRDAYLVNGFLEGADGDCRATLEDLGLYVRSELAPRRKARVDRHLEVCESCSMALAKLDRAEQRLAGLAPLFALAAGWQLTGGAAVLLEAAGGATGVIGAGAGAGATTAAAATGMKLAAVGAAAVAVVGVGVAVATREEPPVVAPVAVASVQPSATPQATLTPSAEPEATVDPSPTPEPASSPTHTALPQPVATPEPAPVAPPRAEPAPADPPAPTPTPTTELPPPTQYWLHASAGTSADGASVVVVVSGYPAGATLRVLNTQGTVVAEVASTGDSTEINTGIAVGGASATLKIRALVDGQVMGQTSVPIN